MPPARGRGRGARGKQPARQSPRSTPAAPTPKVEEEAEVEDAAPAVDETEGEEVEDSSVVEGIMEESTGESKPVEETSGAVVATVEMETENVEALEHESGKEEGEEEGEKKTNTDMTTGDANDQSEEQSIATADEPEQKAAEEVTMQDPEEGNALSTQTKEKADEEVIVIEDDSNDEAGKEKTGTKTKAPQPALSDSETYWRVRVCPVIFDDFCKLKDVFRTIMKMCLSFEFRMSQLLLTPMAKGWNRKLNKEQIPWLPGNEKAFMKPQTAATLGMLEMKVIDSSLVDMIRCVRTAKMSRKGRLRFEIKKISKEEAQHSELKKDLERQKRKPAQSTSKTEKKMDKVDTVEPSSPEEELLVNFALRISTLQEPAFKHEPDHKSVPEDNYIFVKKIPDELPDNVLEAILLMKMVERKKGENSTGEATFDIEDQGNAQQCMERFDGILVNLKDLEMSTTLGTLQDARDKHAKDQFGHAEAVGVGEKRKAESSQKRGSAAKKPRGAYSAGQRGSRGRGAGQRGSRGASRMSRWTPAGGPSGARGRPGPRQGMPRFSPHIPDLRELPMGHQVDNNMLVMQDIHAQVLAARRDLSILQQQARIAQIKLMEEQAMADSYQHNVYAEAHRQGFNQRRGGAYQRDAYSDRYGRANQGGRPYGNQSPGQYREGNRRRR